METETKDFDLNALRIERSGAGFSRRPRRRKILFWTVTLAGIAGLLLLAGDLLNPAVPVQLATASLTSPAQAKSVLTASGYVVARRQAAVASKGTGQLVYLAVEEGDSVKKGQLIARLESSDVEAALERARENLRMQEADLSDAQQSLERQRILLQKQFIAPAEYDAAEARYKRVVASIEAARAAVREAEAAVANTRIYAPFDGTVVNKNADIGEIVAPLAGAVSSRAAVVTIADLNSLEVEADVSESNLTRVFPDQPCDITLDAYPDRHYPGFVSKIVPTADRSKATVQVKIRFKSYDRRVLPEMSAKISFLPKGQEELAQMKPVLTVPATAVATRNGRHVVYQMKDGKAAEVPVTVGAEMGSLIEIKQGLKAGDKVIASVNESIEAGTRVALKTP
ncbi:MAG TPA: efflux RND transporter periplasmic adaptor subunit [Candidatus Acidoferrales bacterium]|nr:efflux RND transporter periplasmic adaptor subunit [Candidatus Acidoferrales bacterium]